MTSKDFENLSEVKWMRIRPKNSLMLLLVQKLNQIFHYTRCITLARVASLRDPSHVIALGNTALLEEMLQWRRTDGDNLSDLSGPKFDFSGKSSP